MGMVIFAIGIFIGGLLVAWEMSKRDIKRLENEAIQKYKEKQTNKNG